MVVGVAASPGRAAGVVKFGDSGRAPADYDGAVFIAPAIRPADAPFIGRSAGVVSTGGGILSHAGLVALELRKPAIIIQGRWITEKGGRSALRYRLPVYTEDSLEVSGYKVLRRLSFSEQEETLQDGVVVVLNA